MSDRLREALDWWEAHPKIDETTAQLHWFNSVPIVDAARRFLALTETGREIRWCEEHDEAVPGGDNPEPRCWFSWHYGSPDRTNIYEKPCRIISLADYLTEEDT